MVEAEGGASDPELAEVRMTEAEYRDLWSWVRRSEKDAEAAKEDAERQKAETWRQANRDLDRAKQKVERKLRAGLAKLSRRLMRQGKRPLI